MPRLYNANALRSGLVVYLAEDFTWSEHIADAMRVDDNDDSLITACEREGLRAVNANEIVEPYWVTTADGSPEQMHMRERMRAKGPTMRTDRDDNAETESEMNDVSL